MIAEDVPTRRRLSARGASWLLAVATFVVHLVSSLVSFARFENGYDLAIFDQAVRHYARFEAPVSMMLAQDGNVLGEHFSPVMALFAPLYWIWDDPRMLLAGQAALVAVSVPVVVRFARRHVSNRIALLIGVGYAFGWPLQGLTGFDVHEIAFAVPVLALALDALLLWGVVLLTVREDMGLILVTLGLLRLLRRDRRWFGLVLVAIGAVGYVVVTAFVIPHLSSTGTWKFWSYDELGPDLPASLRTIVTNPIEAARLFVTPEVKLETLLLLLGPVLFVALRSPYALLLVPLLAARFWSSRESLWEPHFHYSSVVWVVIVLGAVHGLSLLRDGPRRVLARLVAGGSVTTVVVGTAIFPGVFQVGLVVWDQTPSRADARERTEQLGELVAQVPAGTCVVGETAAMSHLLTTNLVGVPGRWDRAADFQVLDRVGTPGLTVPEDALERALADGYVEVASTDDHLLLRSPDFSGPSDVCRP